MNGRLLIGTDEAGYGPNLGPLVVTATAWELPDHVAPSELWLEFRRIISSDRDVSGRRLLIADSKSVYSSGDSLEDLEVAALAFLKTCGQSAGSIDQLGCNLNPGGFRTDYASEPWNPSPGLSLPVDSSVEHIDEWSDVLTSEMGRCGVRLLGVRSRVLFPGEFNELTDSAGSKGVVLSNATLQLIRSLSDQFDGYAATQVFCDKHGGRNRYDEVIAEHFDDQFVFRLSEGRDSSRYRCGNAEFIFRTKAEELLPVALSSMIAKYMREVLMRQFNAFWIARCPGLRPTQGYPVDAKRFRDDVAEHMAVLSIPDALFWRSR